MTTYRTEEQWIEICENAVNGNWSDAFRGCEEYGFYANDMINAYNSEDCHILEDATDIAILAEGAANLR